MKIYHCDKNGSILWNEDPPMSEAYSLDENSSQKWISSNVKKTSLSWVGPSSANIGTKVELKWSKNDVKLSWSLVPIV